MKKLMTSSAALLLSILLYAQETDVKHLLDNERYASAENILERKINTNEASPELYDLLLKTYLEQDKDDEARLFVQQHQLDRAAADADPMNRIAYGRFLLSTGNKTAAVSIFDQVLDGRNRKNPALLIAVADAYIQAEQGDVPKALELLELAARRDKNNPEILILKGNAYRQLKDASNAYLAYQEATKIDPSNVRALYLLGKIFTTQRNADVYMQHFTKAYQLDSTYAPVLDALYDHYYFRDSRKARFYLEKYIANTDYSIENEYRMTDMLYLTGDYARAIASAKALLESQKDSTQPRLYKLIAYSYAGSGDSTAAQENMSTYFAREDSSRWLSHDFEFMAILAERDTASQPLAAAYYEKAVEKDSVAGNKLKWAIHLSNLYKQMGDYENQARWLGNVYKWKERTTNVDLFNWGVAGYNAKQYALADSLFTKYTIDYPDNIFGYYWRAQVNAAIDTSMTNGLAIPHYQKVVEIGETDKEKHKRMLLKAYGYLGGYEANITKDYSRSLDWFEKYLTLDSTNTNIQGYVDLLKKWIAEGKK